MLVYLKNNIVVDIFPAENILTKIIEFPEIVQEEAPNFVKIGWVYNPESKTYSQENIK